MLVALQQSRNILITPGDTNVEEGLRHLKYRKDVTGDAEFRGGRMRSQINVLGVGVHVRLPKE